MFAKPFKEHRLHARITSARIIDQSVARVDMVPGALAPVGSMFQYAGPTAPTGYLLCDGSEVSKTTYAALYAVIGDAFANNPATGNFNLPNMVQRMPIGVFGGEGGALGDVGGASSVVLTSANLPEHTHSYTTPVRGTNTSNGDNLDTTAGELSLLDTSGTGATTGAAGHASPTAVSTMPPYMVLHFIIKYD